MSSSQFDTLQRGITRRQSHLNGAKKVLARTAQTYNFLSATSTTLTVVLGALVATREVADKTLANQMAVAVAFTAMGVLIAAVAGLEAAFQFKAKAAKLRTLAAVAESTKIKIDTQWRKEVNSAYDAEKIQAAHRILDLQDQTLTELQAQAAELGVNMPHELEELLQWEEEPYAA